MGYNALEISKLGSSFKRTQKLESLKIAKVNRRLAEVHTNYHKYSENLTQDLRSLVRKHMIDDSPN